MRQSTLRQGQEVADLESHNRAPFSYKRVWERIYAASCEGRPVTPYDYCHLQRWISTIPARWGLERWCIPQMAQDKARRRRAVVISVRQAYAAGDSARLASLQFSHASTTFAHAVAHGLELSIQTENDRAR